jgi:hypothetical protein
MKGRVAVVVGVVLGALVSGGSFVLAQDRPATSDRVALGAAADTNGWKNSVCLLAYDTHTEYVDLPGAATTVAAVRARKPCPGATIGSFTADTYVGVGGALSIQSMKATCVATGGFSNPCAVGQTAFARLGGNALRWGSGDWETHGVDLLWPNLRRGVWRFEVLVFGRDAAVDSLSTRTFTVTG